MSYINNAVTDSASALVRGHCDTAPAGSSVTDSSLVAAISEGESLQRELYVKYRRPLMQVLLARRVTPDVAQDLMQRTFVQAIQKIRTEGLMEPEKLGGYLHRTACNMAAKYWRGELSRPHESVDDRHDLSDEAALSLEERVDHELLARCVRELMAKLPTSRDREVLMRFYLHEESKASVCKDLELSGLQFNQVLWRARQRFGAILRQHGVSRIG
jgi:RNA polymerase sigma-70 factor, ECF subfamily